MFPGKVKDEGGRKQLAGVYRGIAGGSGVGLSVFLTPMGVWYPL